MKKQKVYKVHNGTKYNLCCDLNMMNWSVVWLRGKGPCQKS